MMTPSCLVIMPSLMTSLQWRHDGTLILTSSHNISRQGQAIRTMLASTLGGFSNSPIGGGPPWEAWSDFLDTQSG